MILIEQKVSHFNISFTYLNPSTINTTIKTPIYYLPNERVIKTEVLPGISDHSCVLMEISVRINRRKQAPHKIWLYKRAD